MPRAFFIRTGYNQLVRPNLLILCALLALIAGFTRGNKRPDIPRAEAGAGPHDITFPLVESGYYSRWLKLDNPGYRISESSCTSAGVIERGKLQIKGDLLSLISEQGKHSEYRLSQRRGLWFLRDGEGAEHKQQHDSVPRLRPAPNWLRDHQSWLLDGLHPGMTHAEVRKMFPKAKVENGFLVVSPYGDSYCPEVQIKLKGDRVAAVEGIRLSLAGRPLLNERSTRGDVEALLGPLDWKASEDSDSRGGSARAIHDKLVIHVSWISGSTYAEARVSSISLQI